MGRARTRQLFSDNGIATQAIANPAEQPEKETMSSAAHRSRTRSRTRISPRSAAALRRLSLRGAAIVYLGGMVAAARSSAVLMKGFGGGLELDLAARCAPRRVAPRSA